MKSFVIALVILFPCLTLAQQQFTFGRYNSRAIFNRSNDSKCNAPLVILVPGSGANGPEEMVPGSKTGDGKDHSIFAAFSEGLRRGHVGTLAIGKPGVDFFKSWDKTKWFYDQTLYENLGWQDLINNLKDAVSYAKTLPCVDPNRIVVLGHSEGTQVAVDFANQNTNDVSGLILVGFSGENLATTLDWQFYRRAIDVWLKPDVDLNKDNFISKSEAAIWPEFEWSWQPRQEMVSLTEIEQALRADTALQEVYRNISGAKIWNGVFNRPAIYSEAASLHQDIFVFTGALDVQTRPEEAIRLQNECIKQTKVNCEVHLVAGLGHAMSEPIGPRKQKLLDSTLGPVSPTFLPLLEAAARRFTLEPLKKMRHLPLVL